MDRCYSDMQWADFIAKSWKVSDSDFARVCRIRKTVVNETNQTCRRVVYQMNSGREVHFKKDSQLLSEIIEDMEWKDATSYSQGDKERKPNVWEKKSGEIRVVLVWNHLNCPNTYCLHCSLLGMSTVPLGDGSLSLEEAQSKAIEYIRRRVKTITRMAENL